MNMTAKWMLGGVAALTVAGLIYAAPVLAAGGYGMMGGGGRASMMSGAGAAGVMNGQGSAMMQGNMAQMHNQMAPLMNEMPRIHTQVMGDVAGRLGMNTEDLLKAMADGQSLAQIAADKNVAIGEVRSAMTTSMKTALDQLVEAKQLTQQQAGQILGLMEQNLASCLDGTGGGMMGAGSMMGGFVPSGTAQ